MAGDGAVLARASCDAEGRLLAAEEPLASLQLRCGGEIPGTIAIPALLELTAKARSFGLKLARAIRAGNGDEAITAWVEVEPLADGTSAIAVTGWQVRPAPAEDPAEVAAHRAAIDRTLAELTARLDAQQCLLAFECTAGPVRSGCGDARGARPAVDGLCFARGQQPPPADALAPARRCLAQDRGLVARLAGEPASPARTG